jgi:hypothetical protein
LTQVSRGITIAFVCVVAWVLVLRAEVFPTPSYAATA